MQTKTLLLAVIVLAAFILISFPVRDLAADYYYRRVSVILDDKTTEELDVPPISEKTLPAFFATIDSLLTAAAIAPSQALYQMALANLYIRLGKWSEVMQALKTLLPAGALSGKEAAAKALVHLRRAVALEPTNPDFHLALGQLYDQQGGIHSARPPRSKRPSPPFRGTPRFATPRLCTIFSPGGEVTPSNRRGCSQKSTTVTSLDVRNTKPTRSNGRRPGISPC